MRDTRSPALVRNGVAGGIVVNRNGCVQQQHLVYSFSEPIIRCRHWLFTNMDGRTKTGTTLFRSSQDGAVLSTLLDYSMYVFGTG